MTKLKYIETVYLNCNIEAIVVFLLFFYIKVINIQTVPYFSAIIQKKVIERGGGGGDICIHRLAYPSNLKMHYDGTKWSKQYKKHPDKSDAHWNEH